MKIPLTRIITEAILYSIVAVEVSTEIDTGKVRTVRPEAISKFHKVKSLRVSALPTASSTLPSPPSVFAEELFP